MVVRRRVLRRGCGQGMFSGIFAFSREQQRESRQGSPDSESLGSSGRAGDISSAAISSFQQAGVKYDFCFPHADDIVVRQRARLIHAIAVDGGAVLGSGDLPAPIARARA